MCTPWCLDFARNLPDSAIHHARVIEIGSYNVNGSCRAGIMARGAWAYLGVDLTPGPGVDMICEGTKLPERLGANSYDIVVCTEVLEHVPDWQALVVAMWELLPIGGHLLLTTRSLGFPYHEYPVDCWRFSVQDMLDIFCDQTLLAIVSDPDQPGVGVVVQKTDYPLKPLDQWKSCCTPVLPPRSPESRP